MHAHDVSADVAKGVPTDVPSPIDWEQPDEVLAWVEETARKRPYRSLFFKAFADQVAEYLLPAGRILELGSGPGLLAEAILANDLVMSYSLIDFSAPMQALARERLAPYDYKLHFLQRDFREPDWSAGLGPFEAIVSLQAVHEVRHKRHVPDLFDHVFDLLPQDGCFLYADHYYDGVTFTNPDLFMTRDEQYDALMAAGFEIVDLVLDEGGMGMYRAVRG